MSDIKEIFIVEDDTIVALDMADLLERLGFEVVGPAVHQEQAIEITRTDKFDAAFLDVNLGGSKTSEPVAEILRQRGIPFIFVTAYDASEISFRVSDERVLKKPVTGDEMLGALRTVLPHHELKSTA